MTTVQLRGKGSITLPAKLRDKYKLQEGEVFTIIDLGNGSFLLKPKVLEVDVLSRRIAKRLAEEDIDMDDWIEALREERKKLFQEKYGNVKNPGKNS
jgi:bifunctional DNA-binding transcriptional regulator/antitoxin component of YhaV-PrlF toxin-antitoxin module